LYFIVKGVIIDLFLLNTVEESREAGLPPTPTVEESAFGGLPPTRTVEESREAGLLSTHKEKEMDAEYLLQEKTRKALEEISKTNYYRDLILLCVGVDKEVENSNHEGVQFFGLVLCKVMQARRQFLKEATLICQPHNSQSEHCVSSAIAITGFEMMFWDQVEKNLPVFADLYNIYTEIS